MRWTLVSYAMTKIKEKYPSKNVCSGCGVTLENRRISTYATANFCVEHQWCFKRLVYVDNLLHVRYPDGETLPLIEAIKRGEI